MSSTQAEHVLDNPVWHTLNSHHAHIASGTALVKRYPTDVSITSAIADHSDVAINDLTQLVASGEIIGLLEAHLPDAIPGWTIQRTVRIDQLVCEARFPDPKTDLDVVELSPADVPHMFA